MPSSAARPASSPGAAGPELAPTLETFILLPTGIADVPVAALDGRTPLQAANTPHLDRLARESRLGLVRQVPEGLRNSSDVAVLSVLGYDPRRNTVSRGAVEAAGMGVELADDDLAFRLNFVSTVRSALLDFRAVGLTRSARALHV